MLREATHSGAASRLGSGPRLEKVLFPEQNYSARESLKLPSSGSLGLNSYPSDHFHASNVKERKEVGSETKMVLVICLVTILPRPGLGRNGDLENVARRFVSVFSKQSLLLAMFWGGTWMKMGAVGRRM